MNPLRDGVLAAARSRRLEKVVREAPVSRSVVKRFVAGDDLASVLSASTALAAQGLSASLDHLGEDTTSRDHALGVVSAYEVLLSRLADAGLASTVEVSVKLTALGLGLDRALALDGAERIVAAATAAGTTVTIDMEDHTRTEETLGVVADLRKGTPTVGAVIQAYLHRTIGDARDLAGPGSRVRLCKGAYAEPASVAFQTKGEVDASYAACLAILMSGHDNHPMVASHDPSLISLALTLAEGRPEGSYEFQMLYGIRPEEQLRLARAGHAVRIYVPYGAEWYGYLMRRLAERPANMTFFARALLSRS